MEGSCTGRHSVNCFRLKVFYATICLNHYLYLHPLLWEIENAEIAHRKYEPVTFIA